MRVFRPSQLSIQLAIALFGVCSMSAHAQLFDAFEVKDIRVEGIQRTEAGTVFSYLPVKVGETLTADKASKAIKALYATGFFKDVRLEGNQGTLIVMLEERSAVASVDFEGMKEFPKDTLIQGLKDLGLAEGRILDRSLLDKAEQEIKRQYFNRGMYAVQVKATTTPLERNRVAINFQVTEGETTKIRTINIVGARAFSEKELLKLLSLGSPGFMSWFTQNDQYSKQKLAGDLEILRSHYMNQGYLEFNIESTQVSITPDKKDIYITINIKEGEKYAVSDVRFAGNSPVPEKELKELVSLKIGDVFSREKLGESNKKIGDRLGNDGYAFANVNTAPELDTGKHTAAFTFLVDPGRKVYVRRINVTGNTRTRDEVVRREMRQMEGGWYAADKITRSRERINRLGYFKDVNIETPPVSGTTDQVDVNVNVEEQPTGSMMLGAGFSSTDGLVLSGSISENNLLGTGNRLAVAMNSGDVNSVYSVSYTNPYFTQDGVSAGYDVYKKTVDTSSLSTTADYTTSTLGTGVRFGIPLTEYDNITLGAVYERVNLGLTSSAPAAYFTFAETYGASCGPANARTACDVTTDTLRMEAGWARDSRDSVLFPTKGTYRRAYGEWGSPLGDIQYYKLNYQHQWLKPITHNISLLLNGEIGFGRGVGGKDLPVFRNFYAGGIGSVRGFDSNALGPKQTTTSSSTSSIGGDTRVIGNAELLFPFPGMGNDKSVRLSGFIDMGQVWGKGDRDGRYEQFALSDLRYSAGIALTWYSPMGPIKLSMAKPLNGVDDDKEQPFQFQLGTVF